MSKRTPAEEQVTALANAAWQKTAAEKAAKEAEAARKEAELQEQEKAEIADSAEKRFQVRPDLITFKLPHFAGTKREYLVHFGDLKLTAGRDQRRDRKALWAFRGYVHERRSKSTYYLMADTLADLGHYLDRLKEKGVEAA